MIGALIRRNARGLTLIVNDTSRPDRGVGKPIVAGAVKRVLTSHIGLYPVTQQKMIAREIKVELAPQSTLVERIRARGFGLGVFWLPRA